MLVTNQHLQIIPIQSGMHRHISTRSYEFLGAPLHSTLFKIHLFYLLTKDNKGEGGGLKEEGWGAY